MGWGRDGLEVKGWSIQTITFRMDEQQVLLYSTGNHIPSSGIKNNGKEY